MIKNSLRLLVASLMIMHVFVLAQQACQVVSVNILAEKFYRNYYHAQAPRAEKMAWSVRKVLLRQHLQKIVHQAAQRNNNFVIAVQECDDQMISVLQKLLLPAGSGLRVFAETDKSRLGFIVGGNWVLADYEDHCSKDEKRFSVMRLTLTDPKRPDIQETMNIINTHFYGGDGPDNDYRLYRKMQMTHIADYIRTTQSTATSQQHWAVCGDFNTDSRTSVDSYKDLLEVLNQSGVHFVDVLKSNPSTRVSAYCRSHTENLDYMFVSADMKVIGTKMNPESNHNMELLTHGYGTSQQRSDAQRSYFSDHCTLSAVLMASA